MENNEQESEIKVKIYETAFFILSIMFTFVLGIITGILIITEPITH